MSSVKVYDLKGSLIYEKNEIGKKEFIIPHLISNDQILIIMSQLKDGKRVSDKVILRE
ncbi:T9SS sorting signal type C domain-containing protein [Flavobacterium aestuarii]|uniref:T9SS sorting signal type C domain-containing protein n=1 Tax=Flavobacterium aestuarii TaxID=3149227 RepID=UPI0032B54B17